MRPNLIFFWYNREAQSNLITQKGENKVINKSNMLISLNSINKRLNCNFCPLICINLQFWALIFKILLLTTKFSQTFNFGLPTKLMHMCKGLACRSAYIAMWTMSQWHTCHASHLSYVCWFGQKLTEAILLQSGLKLKGQNCKFVKIKGSKLQINLNKKNQNEANLQGFDVRRDIDSWNILSLYSQQL
jgi:hypothetical protein